MATSPDKQSLKTFLSDTVTLMCKNLLRFESEFSVEGLIGITLDQKDVILISIHETVKSPDAAKLKTSTSAETESLDVKSTSESTVIASCNVALSQSVASVEDAIQNTAVRFDADDVEMLHDSDIARQPVARQPLDDVKEGDNSTADVKLEVGSVRSILPNDTHSGRMYDRTQDSLTLPSAFTSNAGLEMVTCDDLKMFEKLDHSEKSSSRENRLVQQSTVAERSTSSDGLRAGFSQSGDFEVIEIKEESLSEDEFMALNPNLQLGLPPSQVCGPVFNTQGMSSAMDMTLHTGYSYWEGNSVNAVQAMSQSAVSGISSDLDPSISPISISSSGPNSGNMLVKRGPKRKWKSYDCLKCGNKLSTARGLKKHDAIIHQGNYKFTCHLCGKGLVSEYTLRGHMASRHNMNKDYPCTMCPREFGYKHTLRDHMLACHGVTASVDVENSDIGTVVRGV